MGPKKPKDSKIKTKSNVRIEANLETKVVILYEWTTKHFFIQYPNPQNSPFGPKKPKNNLYIRSKLKVKIGGNIENKCSSAI